MSVFIFEKVGSRETNLRTDSQSIRLDFVAMYSLDEVEVQIALMLETPPVFDGMFRQGTSTKHIGAGVWECTVDYALSPLSLDGESETPDYSIFDKESTFEIAPLTGHLTTSYATRYRWKGSSPSGAVGDTLASGTDSTCSGTTSATLIGDTDFDAGDKIVFEGGNKEYTVTSISGSTVTVSGGTLGATGRKLGAWASYSASTGIGGATDYEHGIGVTKDRVEGVDLPSPSADYTYTHQVPAVTWDYYRTLQALRSTTNYETWRGWQPGEVMYLGTSGSWQTNSFWKLTHRFAMRNNKYAVRVSPTITVPYVGGWEYLWTPFRDMLVSDAVFQVPAHAYVEQVLRRGNFLDIGIGG